MKVCIIGAGAIGGFIGTRLAHAGQAQVCALARGDTLAALRAHGWRLRTAQGLVQAPARATADAVELGPQDLVVIAVKAPALPAVAQSIGPLLGPHTVVLPAMNGVPWWFCRGVPGFDDAPLHSVDPGGVVSQAIAPQRVLGCVVHAATFTPEPGLVHHKMGQGLIVGEPAGGECQLLLRERDARHVSTGAGREFSKTAPAASDLQDPRAGRNLEAGQSELVLAILRLLQRVTCPTIKGARIGHARIEPEPVEVVAEVVVRRDIAPAARAGVGVQPVPDLVEHARAQQTAADAGHCARVGETESQCSAQIRGIDVAVQIAFDQAECSPRHALPQRRERSQPQHCLLAVAAEQFGPA